MTGREGGMPMARKMTALSTLAAFVLMSTACVTWSRKDVKTLASPLPEDTAVLSVVMKSGQVVEFTKDNPGRVRGYKVVGAGKDVSVREIGITGPFSSIRQDSYGKIIEVVDGKGQGYVVKTVLKAEENRMTILGVESNRYSIPLSEVSVVQIRKDNSLMVTAIVLGVLVVLPLLISVALYAL
jgi:hypothetical protein